MLTLFNPIWVFKIICNDIVDVLPSIKANWTCQRQQKHGFSSSACDQVMEQTFNRDSKTKGGLTGFTLNKSAVQRWIRKRLDYKTMLFSCWVYHKRQVRYSRAYLQNFGLLQRLVRKVYVCIFAHHFTEQ